MSKYEQLSAFKLTNEEYYKLDTKFGDLCKYAAWQLLNKNTRNNHTDEFTDVLQELMMHVVIAGMYHKRQTYIESSLESVKTHVDNKFIKLIVEQLEDLWSNRKRHGAGRQIFGQFQEKILEKLVKKIVPKKNRPDRNKELEINTKFITYCKTIAWNANKCLGKKITKEKSLRGSMCSISEYEYLCSN